MKKIFFLMLAVCSLTLVSCGGGKSATAQETAEAFSKAIKAYDAEGIAKLEFGFDKVNGEDQAKGITTIKEAIGALNDENDNFIKTMEIASVDERGETAKAIFKSGDREEQLDLIKDGGTWYVDPAPLTRFLPALFFKSMMPWE